MRGHHSGRTRLTPKRTVREVQVTIRESKAAAIFAALPELEGVDNELSKRPGIAHFPSILE